MMVKSKKIGTKLSDYVILIASWVSIIAAVAGLLFFYFYFDIRDIKPYILLTIILVLGIVGYRAWRKENVD